eukprot:164930_1
MSNICENIKVKSREISSRDVPMDNVANTEASRQVIWMSFCFFLVFVAFSGAQNFATSRESDGNLGNISLSIVYGVFTLATFISGYVVDVVGVKLCLLLGSVSYVGFVAANIFYNIGTVAPTSALLGIGAAVIWTAEGSYITKASQYHEVVNNLEAKSTLGYFNGVFWSIYQANQFIGNLVLAFMFEADVKTWIIFTITTFISVIGTACFYFVKELTRHDAYAQVGDEENQQRSSDILKPNNSSEIQSEIAVERVSIYDTVAMWKRAPLLALIPMTIFSGFSQAFIFGEFPTLISDNAQKFYTMSVFGFSDMAASYILGKVSDRFGRLETLMIGFVASMILYIALFLSSMNIVVISELWMFMILAVFMGIGDAGYNTQIYALYGSIFKDCSASAFANFKLFQSASMTIAFIYHGMVSMTTKLIITISWTVLGILFAFLSPSVRQAVNEKRKG